jgi:DNA transposition AAA+ family ATPase
MTTETTVSVPSASALQAEASSAHARINIPLNLENWKHIAPEIQTELLWFHQYILDHNLGWKAAEDATGYDQSTIFRVLKGTYTGSWQKIVDSIKSFRRISEKRGQIQVNEFAENSLTKLIWAGLDYALANNSITMIIGESRMGKTLSAKTWAAANNHGRSVFVTASPIGGIKTLMRAIAQRVGVNKNLNMSQMAEAIYRAFNSNRILIVDEFHRLLPSDSRTVNPTNIEFLRDLHDQTGCALALMSTQRAPDRLERGAYQYEQLIGRIGMPIRLPVRIQRKDILPIVEQYIERPSKELMVELEDVANRPGRLGIVVELLKVASRIAAKQSAGAIEEAHVFKAIDIRRQMSGEKR